MMIDRLEVVEVEVAGAGVVGGTWFIATVLSSERIILISSGNTVVTFAWVVGSRGCLKVVVVAVVVCVVVG